jgi:phosphohistidine phosphatase
MGTMKKELFIVRHAKSSWDLENISDIDRPLSLRGIRNAYEMARHLKIERNIPELFISSPANRALHTATIFLNVFELLFDKLKIDNRLYGLGVHDIQSVIYEQPKEIRKIMIFGHNPDFTELAKIYSKNPIFEIPTCGIVILTFNCANWTQIGKETLSSEIMDSPKKE